MVPFATASQASTPFYSVDKYLSFDKYPGGGEGWSLGTLSLSGFPPDADPGLQDPVLWLQHTNTHRLQKSCGEKGLAWPLSQEESILALALTGFYCFSRPLTSKMVLIYYA